MFPTKPENLLDQDGYELTEICYNTVMSLPEEQGVLVRIDGDDYVRGLHAHGVLHSPGDPARDVQLR